MRKGTVSLASMLCMVLTVAVAGAPPVRAATSTTCHDVAEQVEQREGLPAGLLYAIALTESGRWDPNGKRSYAWPWTVRAGADAFVATTSAGALSIVRELQAQGRKNIDVGCMQVNLMYHGENFASLEQSVDPAANMTYAARFLKTLRSRTGTWARAIEHYHSSDPVRGRDYRTRVTGYWNKVKRNGRIVQATLQDPVAEKKRSAHGSLFTETRFFSRTGMSIDIVRPVASGPGTDGRETVDAAAASATPATTGPGEAGGRAGVGHEERARNDRKHAVRASDDDAAGSGRTGGGDSRRGSIIALHGLDALAPATSLPKIYRPGF